MSQTTLFSSEWLHQFSDPYAVLGLSVTADNQRVLKRYRTVAKWLHPDSNAIADKAEQESASQLLARLVNPAYQQLKQEKDRIEILAVLRNRSHRLSQEGTWLPKSEVAQNLLKVSPQELEVFYEQAVSSLAESQFRSVAQFEFITPQLGELNLLYFHLKLGEPQVREKRTGIISATQAKPAQFTPSPSETAQIATSFAQRHYQRAQEYARKEVWSQVVVELRDAIRLEADRSEFHSLLAKAYLMQNLTGMAKVHFRQALKFNPNDPLALQYAARLGVTPLDTTVPGGNAKDAAKPGSVAAKTSKNSGIFSLFGKKR